MALVHFVFPALNVLAVIALVGAVILILEVITHQTPSQTLYILNALSVVAYAALRFSIPYLNIRRSQATLSYNGGDESLRLKQ